MIADEFDGNFTVGRSAGVQHFTYPYQGPMLRGAPYPLPGTRQAGVNRSVNATDPDPVFTNATNPISQSRVRRRNDAYTVRGAAAHYHPLLLTVSIMLLAIGLISAFKDQNI